MGNEGLHPGLELRMATLSKRITRLKQAANTTQGSERLAAMAETERLERRYMRLEGELNQLNAEGPGFRQNFKAEIEKRIDDVAATIEDFMIRLDRA